MCLVQSLRVIMQNPFSNFSHVCVITQDDSYFEQESLSSFLLVFVFHFADFFLANFSRYFLMLSIIVGGVLIPSLQYFLQFLALIFQ